MLNKIVCDKDLNVELVINLQEPRTFDDTWANSIIISVDADDTASQSLTVDAGEATGSYPVTPSQINEIEIETEYWNMGGATTIKLVKGSTDYGTIIINFPDQIDSLGMLNRDENIETTFTMTGSYNDPSDIATKVEEKQDKLVAGEGISIEGNVISASGGGGGGGLDYILDQEQNTNRKWVNGKDIMQKTVLIPNLPNPNGGYVRIQVPDIETLVKIEGVLVYAQDNYEICADLFGGGMGYLMKSPLGGQINVYYNAGGLVASIVPDGSGNVGIINTGGNSYSNLKAYVTLFYTLHG